VAEAAAALSGVRAVCAALRLLPLCGGIRARARSATGLPVRHLVGDDGADAVAAADRHRTGTDRDVAPGADAAAGERLTGDSPKYCRSDFSRDASALELQSKSIATEVAPTFRLRQKLRSPPR